MASRSGLDNGNSKRSTRKPQIDPINDFYIQIDDPPDGEPKSNGKSNGHNGHDKRKKLRLRAIEGGKGKEKPQTPIDKVLDKFPDAESTKNDAEWLACCPVHGDQHPSLIITKKPDGKVLMHCRAGCDVKDICDTVGLRLSDLKPKNTSGVLLLVELAAEKNLPAAELQDFGLSDLPKKGVGIRYRDYDGARVCYKLRTALRAKEGSRWPKDKKVMPYGRERLKAAREAGELVLVEGESDCWALWHHEIHALGLPGAATTETLKVKDLEDIKILLVHQEPDSGGQKFVEGLFERLRTLKFDLEHVLVVKLEGAKDPSELHQQDESKFMERWEAAKQKAVPIATALGSNKPVIYVGTDEDRVVNEAIAAIVKLPNVYERGGLLVRTASNDSTGDKRVIRREVGSPRIELIPMPWVEVLLSKAAEWRKPVRKKWNAVTPPKWATAAVATAEAWPGARKLTGILETPTVRPDGTILNTPGYDEQTGLFYRPVGEVDAVPENPTKEEVKTALDGLLEVVCDVPFAAPMHKAAWLAALLTPLCRWLYDGPSPLVLFDASMAASGKTLNARVLGQILLGRTVPTMSWPTSQDSEPERRKQITSIALAGDSLVLLDNIEGLLGGPALNAVLTSTDWRDRLLGITKLTPILPLTAMWMATANNCTLGRDVARRTLPVRLEPMVERPEERKDFKHPNLEAWAHEERHRLVAHVLTVIRAWCVAGKPQPAPKLGTFEGWSSVVRQIVVWLGLPDPVEAQTAARATAEPEKNESGAYLFHIKDFMGLGNFFSVGGLLDKVAKNPQAPIHAFFSDVFNGLPTTLVLSKRFSRIRGQVYGGLRLVTKVGDSHLKVNVWAVERVSS